MKKLLLYMGCAVAMLSACDPNDEFIDTLDSEAKASGIDIPKDELYTLTADDYDIVGKGKYDNFDSDEEAADSIPKILAERFAANSSDGKFELRVSYNVYRGSLDYIYSYGKLGYFELTSGDYDGMGEESGQPGKYDSFSSSVAPEDFLPAYLKTKYDEAESGDVLEINYKYYADGSTSNVSQFYSFNGTIWAVADIDSYELAGVDYDSMGAPGKYDNFSDSDVPEDYLPAFLSEKYPSANKGELLNVIYKYYEGGGVTATRNSYYSYNGTTWAPYGITVPSGVTLKALNDDNYSDMGFNLMFSNDTDYSKYVPRYLEMEFPYAQVGDKIAVTYKYKDGDIKKGAVEYTFIDGMWVEYQSAIVSSAPFKFDGTVWAVVPPIKFVRVDATDDAIIFRGAEGNGAIIEEDYALVGNGYYKNFDVRAGKSEETEAVRIEKLSKIIKNNYDDLALDQVYFIQYKVYAGSEGIESQDSDDDGLWDIYLKAVEDN